MKLAKERFKIIEPFFKKEKKLIDIENESNISYSTLKRWVTSYKKEGIDGLEKKERSDKNNHKKIDDEKMDIIKNLYMENYNLSISKLYEKSLSTLSSINCEISYPTFYRVISSLDEFIKKSSNFHIEKISKPEEIFSIFQFPIYFPFLNFECSVFYLTLFFEIKTFKIINFSFDQTAHDFTKLFPFIRESILKCNFYPKEIILTNTIGELSNNKLRKCFFETGIIFTETDSFDLSELKKLCNFIQSDLKKVFENEINLSLEKVNNFINLYFFGEDTHSTNLKKSEKVFDVRKLDFFLSNSNRKVYNYGIRVKNSIYFNPLLEKLTDKIVHVKYSQLDKDTIFIFYNNSFLCEGFLVKN
ncbi:MAG: Mu transposase C-terminal domain-containing protein [Cetobacterium sp.]|uniref:Mu transposase C-terminal domain-containing protein n=1 Tax=unclassified Cetobacterium TaxID=2630983 RepID=UPI00163BE474|nr:Mu transposase C-terminal domain-containing protein [Cetobacterium sp. 2A]MBC2855749.1 Mu transposase C-terminal domain-containing protein [Cetobacterium sp. 2A]